MKQRSIAVLEGIYSAGATIAGGLRSASRTVAFNGTAVAPTDLAYDAPGGRRAGRRTVTDGR